MIHHNGSKPCRLCGLYGTHCHTEPEVERLRKSCTDMLESWWEQPSAPKPRPFGPKVRRVRPEGARPPTCIHCGGPTQLIGQSTYAVHITVRETEWACSLEDCPGYDDVVIISTPLGEYHRRC